MSRLSGIKRRKFVDQRGRCFYCRQPMWIEKPDGFASQYGLTTRRAAFLMATAEHLVARQDGGPDTCFNVVAACLFCNVHRHRSASPKPWPDYARLVN